MVENNIDYNPSNPLDMAILKKSIMYLIPLLQYYNFVNIVVIIDIDLKI